jgi:transcription initiation factor TFIID subunit 5
MSSEHYNSPYVPPQRFDNDVFQKVIEYLSKKGYTRTEAMLRNESATQDADGQPRVFKAEDAGGAKYGKGLQLTRAWIETNLEIFKPELRRLLWPLFVYSFLNVIQEYFLQEGRTFFDAFKGYFEDEHPDDLRALNSISLPEHIDGNEVAKIYLTNKYRLTLSIGAFVNLIQFLEKEHSRGGSVMSFILSTHMKIVTVERAADDTPSLAKLLGRIKTTDNVPAEDEGIPGHNPGSANTDRHNTSVILTKLKLGPLPMDPELLEDVEAELDELEKKEPALAGENTLVEEFKQMIKREESEEAPSRSEIPLPPSKARDVMMEVQKVRENRDRFKIEGRTGGVGPTVTVCMFTLHNTYDK